MSLVLAALLALQVGDPGDALGAAMAAAVFDLCAPVVASADDPDAPAAFGPLSSREIERRRWEPTNRDRSVHRVVAPGTELSVEYQDEFTFCTVLTFQHAPQVFRALTERLAADGWLPIADAPSDVPQHWWQKPGGPLVLDLQYNPEEPEVGVSVEMMNRERGQGVTSVAAFPYRRRSFRDAVVSAVFEVCPASVSEAPTPEQEALLHNSTVWNESFQVFSTEGEVYLTVEVGYGCRLSAFGGNGALAEAAVVSRFEAEPGWSPIPGTLPAPGARTFRHIDGRRALVVQTEFGLRVDVVPVDAPAT